MGLKLLIFTPQLYQKQLLSQSCSPQLVANSFFCHIDIFDADLCSWHSSFLSPPSHLSANCVTHTTSMPSIQLFLTTFIANTTIWLLGCINNLLTLKECFNLPIPQMSLITGVKWFVKTHVKLGYFPLCFLALPQILEAVLVSGPSHYCRRICLGFRIPDIYLLLSPIPFWYWLQSSSHVPALPI